MPEEGLVLALDLDRRAAYACAEIGSLESLRPLLQGADGSPLRTRGRGVTESPGSRPDGFLTPPARQVTGPQEREEILATTYFPEGLPPQYLRRWRA